MINNQILNSLTLLTVSGFEVNPTRLVTVSILGIAFLVFLIIKIKVHAFVSLLVAALIIGIAIGMTPQMIITSMNTGVATTMQGIAILVGIGSMFGALLEKTGGAEVITTKMLKVFGEKKAVWAMAIAGIIIAIPVFFDAALLIVIPLAFGLARKTKKSTLLYGIPLIAGLSASHAMLPPTPGPIIVADILGVDLGYVILAGFISAPIAVLFAGPIYGKYINNKINAEIPEVYKQELQKGESKKTPSFGLVVGVIFIPLMLILLNTGSNAMLASGNHDWLEHVRPILLFVGHPPISLLIATLFAMFFLGTKHGYNKSEIGEFMGKSLTPVGMILLVTAGGGVLRFIFEDSGLGAVAGTFVAEQNIPIILVAFLIAAVARISLGSATVAMMMSAGILAGMPLVAELNPMQLAALTIAIASGGTFCSHFNDSGFWLVKSLFDISERDTLRTWTVITIIIGIVGLVVSSLIYMVA